MAERTSIRLIHIAAILCLAATTAPATTWHVDPNNPAALPTIQDGINQAKHYDTVVVHPGIYVETISFRPSHHSHTSPPLIPTCRATILLNRSDAVSWQMGKLDNSIFV